MDIRVCVSNEFSPFWGMLCRAFGRAVRATACLAFTFVVHLQASENRLVDETLEPPIPPSPDWSAIDVVRFDPATSEGEPAAYGPITPSARQPAGALSGKVVFMNCGHGWTYESGYPWRLLRPVMLDMNEDYGNIDQLNMFATYCFNAGAVVVPMRPLGFQTNEVVLDNDAVGVTYTGTWTDSTATSYFYGTAGDVPYRFANLAASETATARFTPNIPASGYYPVYCWVAHGANRADQLYRILHTGGESQVRIPHYMVGNGWVYLGEYYFNAGSNPASGAVVISNLRGSANGSIVIADAIRFGNGMGSINRGAGVSDYPREDESCRYWVQAGLGVGMPASLYDGGGDDESDSWSTPSKMSAEMNRQAFGSVNDRIHISFHSNAGGGRGTVGLITGDPTPNQAELAQLCGKEVNDDLVALGSPPLEVPWYNRSSVTYSGGYSEIDGSLFNYEMAATIIEVAFHDNDLDSRLMRDPKARASVGKAAMHAVVKYMAQYGGGPLAFLPESPSNPRATGAADGSITLNWTPPVSVGGSGAPTNYVVYRSVDGFGFGNPVSVGNVTSHTMTGLAAGADYYFRIAAANAGGESLPSEVIGCRAPLVAGAPRVLVVNGFDRFDRTVNLRQNTTVQNYRAPGNNGAIERVWPRRINAFDYVVPHGKAISAYGMAFDSCQNEAVIGNQVALANYAVVVWACGNETVGGETLNSTEQSRLGAYLAAGGSVFVSGADVAYDLDRPSGPTTADRTFLRGQLRAGYSSDNSGNYNVNAAAAGIFVGRAGAMFDDGFRGSYWVQSPDVLAPVGAGAIPALMYQGSSSPAAVQYDGSAGGGPTVVFGFPFETITSSARRSQYMADILDFLTTDPATNVPPSIANGPANLLVVQGAPATLSVLAAGTWPLSYQWRFNGANLPGASASVYTRLNAQPVYSGNYQVVVTNAFGAVTSQVATLEVGVVPPPLFSDNFDANTAANWHVNASSADTRVTFNYNYSANGIPSAPGSGGTTRGVKFEANMTAGTPAAISISPAGGSFTGNFGLRFNMWINANGPFPLGGTGSTEHLTAGIGTTGNRVQWSGSGSNADGPWFAVNGEGQASDEPSAATTLSDFCAFSGPSLYPANSGVYAAGTASNARGNGNGYYAGTFSGGQNAPAAQQSTYPQQTGSLGVGTVGFEWRDVLVRKTGTTVEWFIDGLKISTINNASLGGNNFFVGYFDSFASLSDNANLSFGLVDNVRIETYVTNVPPYLTSQPQSQVVKPGTNATFSVAAGGTTPRSYQWRFNGSAIPGATLGTYTRSNTQASDAGLYSVVVTNLAGTVTSASATLAMLPVAPPRFGLVSLLPNGDVALLLKGEAATYEIQTSTNLLNWGAWTNVVITNSSAVQIIDLTSGQRKFYRAVAP